MSADTSVPKYGAAYMREYRRRHPDYVTRQRADNRARQRAYTRLARRHLADFWRLYLEERLTEHARAAAQAAAGGAT